MVGSLPAYRWGLASQSFAWCLAVGVRECLLAATRGDVLDEDASMTISVSGMALSWQSFCPTKPLDPKTSRGAEKMQLSKASGV